MYYLVRIAYDGSKFYGFQRLNKHLSVQKVLEDALTKINKKEVVVKGAGRTDRGVHALDQGVSFKLDIKIDKDGLKEALNSLIGPYIYVNEVIEVDENFHARFSTVSKKYVYKINLGNYNVYNVDYIYQCPYKLNIDLIKQVGDLYLGIHDFRNFVSGTRDNYEAIIYDINYKIDNDILEITFHGKSFYRYMVRNLVGMMIEVGRGKDKVEKVKRMLDTDKDLTGYTAPACGLYLYKIEY